MDDMIYALVREIERNAFPYFHAQMEYDQNLRYAEQHTQWLEQHLSGEERDHWEKARDAELCMDTLEREALIRTALAVGIRLTLSH